MSPNITSAFFEKRWGNLVVMLDKLSKITPRLPSPLNGNPRSRKGLAAEGVALKISITSTCSNSFNWNYRNANSCYWKKLIPDYHISISCFLKIVIPYSRFPRISNSCFLEDIDLLFKIIENYQTNLEDFPGPVFSNILEMWSSKMLRFPHVLCSQNALVFSSIFKLIITTWPPLNAVLLQKIFCVFLINQGPHIYTLILKLRL